jgi:hypothetical protein
VNIYLFLIPLTAFNQKFHSVAILIALDENHVVKLTGLASSKVMISAEPFKVRLDKKYSFASGVGNGATQGRGWQA